MSTGCDVCPHENVAHAQDDGACLVLDCPCQRWREPSMSFPLVYDEDLRCLDCARLMLIGTPYSTRLDAIDDDAMPWVAIICVYCALSTDD